MAGRLGIASGYGAPSEAYEEAFERGCNYFYYMGRGKKEMERAVRNIVGRGRRDDLIVAVHSYARHGFFLENTLNRALNRMGIERADILLLGWYGRPPSPKLLDKAANLIDRGRVRSLGISGHKRRLFAHLAETGRFDLFHVRYNAAHRGAETDVFEPLRGDGRPGIVTYTATRWGHLLQPKKMPDGTAPPTAADCYRFVLSHPDVDVCLTGPKTTAQMREALTALDAGPLNEKEMARMKTIGDHIHTHHKGFF
jgi:predicted aldo/keto reductase-like oxidoreductase